MAVSPELAIKVKGVVSHISAAVASGKRSSVKCDTEGSSIIVLACVNALVTCCFNSNIVCSYCICFPMPKLQLLMKSSWVFH